MKKTATTILAAAAAAVALLAVSCVKELDVPQPVKGDHTAICLEPVCASPVTKADPATEDGDDTYNERIITDYYWFLYRDAEGTDIVLSGHETGYETADTHVRTPKNIILDSYFPTGGTVYVYVVANLPVKPDTPAEGDEWFEFDGSDPADPVIRHMVQGASAASCDISYSGTLSSLRTLAFGKNTPLDAKQSISAGQSEFYRYTSATTGVPAPEKFVMRTDAPVPCELLYKQEVPVQPKLKRIASKIILDLHVAKTVKQTYTNAGGQDVYVKSWDADLSHIQVYMLWGSTHGTLSGTKYHYGEDGADPRWFYSASPRYAMYTNPTGGAYSDGTVLGSVPESLYPLNNKYLVKSTVWDDVYEVTVSSSTTANGWMWKNGIAEADKIPEHEGDYYYGDWNYTLDGNGHKIHVLDEESGNYARRRTTQTSEKPYYEISSLPLYSMPISWNVNDTHAPFIKVILPWQGYKRANNGDGDPIPGSYDAKTTEFYYKILIPKRTSIDANGCYHISLELSVLGSEADDVPVELEGKYHVVDWNTPQVMGGDQNAGRYLNCATYFEFYAKDEMEIPVISSHDIEVVPLSGSSFAQTAQYNNYSTLTPETLYLTRSTGSTVLTAGQYYRLETTDDNQVKIRHTCESSVDDMQKWDVSPITYRFRIRHADNANFYKDITVVQYPSLYIRNQKSSIYDEYYNNWYHFYSIWFLGYSNVYDDDNDLYFNQGYVLINNNNYYGSMTYDDYGAYYTRDSDKWYYVQGIRVSYNNVIQTGTNQNPNMYVITTTVLDPDLGAVLGDPRVEVIDNLTYSFAQAPAVYGSSPRSLSYYYPTDRTDRTENMIAPSFRIASSYGKCGESSTFEDMQARCAAYQEDGYPAGRWRVPTKAELQYITTLSAKGLIPSLFNTIELDKEDPSSRSRYYSAHGLVKVNLDGTVTENTEHTTGWVRCVYDEWYWKDDTVAKETFKWGDRAR